MRGSPARTAALAIALTLTASVAHGGGPSLIRPNGLPFVHDTTNPIPYQTDNGPLSASVTEAAARSRVDAMFDVWQNVASANISYTRTEFIADVGAFTDGDVSTIAEYDAVEGDCVQGDQSPIVYDANATIFIALGIDETSVIGFAGPCSFIPAQGLYLSGQAVMNGLFQDGDGGGAPDVPDLTAAEFDATFIHEFGHFSGLDHSQINVNCVVPPNCSTDDLAGLPTMFPFIATEQQVSLSTDDVAWISRLYPAPSFATTHGTITGTVLFSDGESHAQLVNVIARRVDDLATVGVNESRTTAGSNVSGYKFRFFHGNAINDPDGDVFGTQVPAHNGLYEISVPPGNYMIEVESVHAEFIEGSGLGGPIRIEMPGTAPAPIGPITVTAGATSSGNDVILVGTDPRFDQFEGP